VVPSHNCWHSELRADFPPEFSTEFTVPAQSSAPVKQKAPEYFVYVFTINVVVPLSMYTPVYAVDKSDGQLKFAARVAVIMPGCHARALCMPHCGLVGLWVFLMV
jgi:hypothetical protein